MRGLLEFSFDSHCSSIVLSNNRCFVLRSRYKTAANARKSNSHGFVTLLINSIVINRHRK